ncbi:MAG: Uma2 family endonuclease [Dehalococcoidia bacterium]
MVYAPPKRKLTADEYQCMGQHGIIGEDERVELLDGELYLMPPIGDGHIGDVNSLDFHFNRRLGNRAIVSVQNPIRLSDFSEPEPDITILRFRPDFYRKGKARPEDVLLLVEVAESSLAYDRLTKLPRYASAGIPEVWIVNLVDDRVEVYRDPTADGYRSHTVHGRGETLTPLALPDVSIRVEEILG